MKLQTKKIDVIEMFGILYYADINNIQQISRYRMSFISIGINTKATKNGFVVPIYSFK